MLRQPFFEELNGVAVGQEPQDALEEAWLMPGFTEAVALRAATGTEA
jgi:hypothetical protein